jgi:hypothetical protein
LISGVGINLFFITTFEPTLKSNQPPIWWVPWNLYLRVKYLECEYDHRVPFSDEYNVWSYKSTCTISSFHRSGSVFWDNGTVYYIESHPVFLQNISWLSMDYVVLSIFHKVDFYNSRSSYFFTVWCWSKQRDRVPLTVIALLCVHEAQIITQRMKTYRWIKQDSYKLWD